MFQTELDGQFEESNQNAPNHILIKKEARKEDQKRP
jgi:hypothetical protein